jgi:hypothetical protein
MGKVTMCLATEPNTKSHQGIKMTESLPILKSEILWGFGGSVSMDLIARAGIPY